MRSLTLLDASTAQLSIELAKKADQRGLACVNRATADRTTPPLSVSRRLKVTQMKKIKVALADDHTMLLEGMRSILEQHGMSVVAETLEAAKVVDMVRKSGADVLVLDIRFGGAETGLDIAQELLAVMPHARVVFYSQFDQIELIRRAYRVGGAGFVAKNAGAPALIEAIKTAYEGKTYYTPDVAMKLANMAVHGDDSPATKLTARELQVFRLMANGSTNVEMAERLGLSPKTISNESQSIKDKLGIHRPVDIARMALKYNLISE